MQLGSGTWDMEPGITWRGNSDTLGWGAQVKGTIRLGDNDQGYSYGNRAMATAWLGYVLTRGVSLSGHLQAETIGQIDDIDPLIAGPVQTANPDFHGGESMSGFVGVNFAATGSALKGWRLGLEGGVPLVQYLNGPQMPNDWSLTMDV